MRDEILFAKNIAKSFGALNVLNSINLSIKRGDRYTLFGSNGVGKTTLVKILSTIMPADSGELILFGKKINRRVKDIKNFIGFMSHESFLYNELTAWENLNFYADLYSINEKEKKIEDILKEIGLFHRSYDRVGTFSRGMRQRLSLARAILHSPELIFLDEPYAGLDIKAQKMLNDIIRRLNNEGKTFFFIIHNIAEVFNITNKIGILSQGKIVYEFEGDEKKNFTDKYQEVIRRETN